MPTEYNNGQIYLHDYDNSSFQHWRFSKKNRRTNIQLQI